MTLPATGSTAWPPPHDADRYRRMKRPEAWYGGDPDRLAGVYAGGVQTVGGPSTTVNAQAGIARRVAAAVRGMFWGEANEAEVNTKRHLPVAEDIAKLSAGLLFSERPILTIVGEGATDDDGQPTEAAQAALAELHRILERCGWHATLLSAFEIAPALGSTGLRIAVDPTGPLRDQPILAKVDADAVVPTHSWGILSHTTFWTEVRREASGTIWRYLEDHDRDLVGRSVVYHGLYKGDAQQLGARFPLDTEALPGNPFTKLAEVVDDQGAIVFLEAGVPGTTAVSIPNMLPDPLDRKNATGRSDFTPAVMDLFDAVDKSYSQLMDEVDDAKSRLFLGSSMLNDRGAGQGLGFDMSQRLFHRVNVPPSEDGGKLPIERVQFEMRVDQYLTLIDSLVARALDAAGYTANTDHGESGEAMTATEYIGRNRKSMATRDKKSRYVLAPLGDLLTGMLQVHLRRFAPAALTGVYATVAGFTVQVTLSEAVQPTQLELAATAKALLDAQAASTRTRVKTAQPELTGDALDAEVAALEPTDPVTLGLGGQGVGPGDGV
jgi:hypothetical protein